jgi:hypothetical protein
LSLASCVVWKKHVDVLGTQFSKWRDEGKRKVPMDVAGFDRYFGKNAEEQWFCWEDGSTDVKKEQ